MAPPAPSAAPLRCQRPTPDRDGRDQPVGGHVVPGRDEDVPYHARPPLALRPGRTHSKAVRRQKKPNGNKYLLLFRQASGNGDVQKWTLQFVRLRGRVSAAARNDCFQQTILYMDILRQRRQQRGLLVSRVTSTFHRANIRQRQKQAPD